MILASFTRSGRTSSRRLAISALAIAVVVFVVVGVAVELVFLPKASSPSTGSATTTAGVVYCASGCPTPSTVVKTAVDQWVQDFNNRNVQGLGNLYSTDSAVTWTGQAAGLAGTYNGQANVRILYGSSIGKTTSLNASIANYVEKVTNPSNVNVTLDLNMKGNSSVVGALTSTVGATQVWNYVGGQWQIVQETWNYKTFVVQYPVSATTFPQWGAMRAGQNPNLVSEKSFEWHAGPYVAASVYAFLGGIVAIGVMMYARRSRPT
jgi:hypothetical protein